MTSLSKRTLCRPVIIKIGTASLTNSLGLPEAPVMASLCRQLAALRAAGNKLILVTSGAVGMGRNKLGWAPDKPLSDREKSLAASVGQPYLMRVYADYFESFGLLPPGQVLAENKHYANGDDTPRWNLLDYFDLAFNTPRFIPVLNENDVLSRVEIKTLSREGETFSDNDKHASLLANLVDARQIAIISTHCVHTGNPCHPSSKPVPSINFASKRTGLAGLGIRTDGMSCGGSGGMANKLEAARIFLEGDKARTGKRSVSIISTKDLLEDGLLRVASGRRAGTRLVCQTPKRGPRAPAFSPSP